MNMRAITVFLRQNLRQHVKKTRPPFERAQEFSANLPLKMRRMTMQRWCKTFWITRTFLFFGQKIPDGLMPLFWITYRSGNMNVSVRGRWNVFFIPLMRMVSWPWNLTVGLQGKLTPQSYNFSFDLRKIEKHWKYFESPSVHPSISFRSWTKPAMVLFEIYTCCFVYRVWIAHGWRWFERNRICERSKLCPSAACKSCAPLGFVSMRFGHVAWQIVGKTPSPIQGLAWQTSSSNFFFRLGSVAHTIFINFQTTTSSCYSSTPLGTHQKFEMQVCTCV